MNKIFKFIMVALMSLSLLVGCSTTISHKRVMDQPTLQTYKIDIVNATKHFAIAIVCIVKINNGEPEGNCLFDPIALYPKRIVDRNPGKKITNKVTVNLPPGNYAFLVIQYDVRTGKQSQSEMLAKVYEDSQLVFQEKLMTVGGSKNV